jgi:Tol biopolymer transport system component/DNA-binding winged helix-turn-helix (wHTH) protein
MGESSVRWDRVRFGVFEADLRTGELRKSGIRIRLQSLPFKLLSILLEHPGEIVTREELQQRIWGDSTVVDFDHSLGTAVNKIREALGDSAESPRFIETLARRGYRFIGTVQNVEQASASTVISSFQTTVLPIPLPVQPPELSKSELGLEAKTEVSQALSPELTERKRTNFKLLGLISLAGSAAVLVICSFLLVSVAQRDPFPSSIIKTTEITWSDQVYPGDIGLESFPGLVTDGTRIYFPEIRNGAAVLVHSSPGGGESYPLPIPPEVVRPSLADISPDGSKFLVQSHQWSRVEEPLWIVPSNGGSASRVRGGLAHDGTWAPDGQSILYASGNDLFVTSNDGQAPRKLASVPGRAFWLRYSPDGSEIRFTVLDPATHATSLWEISADGKKLRPLLAGWNRTAGECCGSWTSDGKYFVFQSRRDGQNNIWTLRESRFPSWSSREPIQLTAGPLDYLAPLPAHQSNRIFVIGARSTSHLSRYDFASHQFVRFLPGLSAATNVALSQDGSRVAWISTIDGSLWQGRLDASQRLQLTSPPMQIYMMRWSPDGKTIAFMGKQPGSPWKIYLVPADGGNPELLLNESGNQADPGWSSDGKTMIFGRSPEYMAQDSNTKAIYSIDIKTRAVSTLPGSVGLFSPRQSPDGRYIAAMPLDQYKLLLFDSLTGKWTDLADKGVDNPTWSSDGQSIFFHAFMEEGQPIYRVRISDHRLERVVDFHDLQPAEALDYLGLTPNGEPIITVHVWTSNLYALDWGSH